MSLPDPRLEHLYLEAESRLGIKADSAALAKFQDYLIKTYGEAYHISQPLLSRVFSSGEAARFLTVNETYFFREQGHFFFLLKELLPSFEPAVKLRICSAAASSGCEAYSIAMILKQYNSLRPPHERLDYHIDAFDLNPDVIARAEQGVYRKNVLREDGSSFRYLIDRWGAYEGEELKLDPALAEHIHFFQHNIMDALPENSYDIIFFRNAFIYFSPRSRVRVLSNLAAALRTEAVLIMGVAETAAVNHPLLDELTMGDVFYFKKSSPKIGPSSGAGVFEFAEPVPERPPPLSGGVKLPLPKRASQPPADRIDPRKIETIMADEAWAEEITSNNLKALEDPQGADHAEQGNELAASALFLLNRGDFAGAAPLLDFLEKSGGNVFTGFLRGEYFYLQDMFTEAEFHYKIAQGKNDSFWPACYRLSSLAAGGVLHSRRVLEAIESLKRGKEQLYEVFIGGFSPDYYLEVLLKQNAVFVG
jgi:chemotaxis protein methyltransferase CheR